MPSFGGRAVPHGSPSLALPRSVRRGVRRCCAVARWFRAVPRAPLGRVLFVLRVGAGRDSPSSIRHARYDVRVVLLKSIGVCGQRFPPTPSRSHATARGGGFEPRPRADDSPQPDHTHSLTNNPRRTPPKGRGELCTPVRPAREQAGPVQETQGRGELRENEGRPAPEERPQGGSIQGREELRTHGRPAQGQVRPGGRPQGASKGDLRGTAHPTSDPHGNGVRPARETPGCAGGDPDRDGYAQE